MTAQELWSASHGAVCSIRHRSGATDIAQGTGFLVGEWLVTNNHVIQCPPATHVRVQFVGSDGHSVVAAKLYTAAAFNALLVDGEPETGWDFAVLKCDTLEFKAQPRLSLASTPAPPIGAPINFLGCHFEDSNLSIGSGHLASKYSRSGVDYLQLDASVNSGNSGGPLIDPSTGQVIGIVTRKATGLSKQFDALAESFENNAAAVQPLVGAMQLGNFDMMGGFQITQNQLKGLAMEMKRSANVGIGYAYDISKVQCSLTKLG